MIVVCVYMRSVSSLWGSELVVGAGWGGECGAGDVARRKNTDPLSYTWQRHVKYSTRSTRYFVRALLSYVLLICHHGASVEKKHSVSRAFHHMSLGVLIIGVLIIGALPPCFPYGVAVQREIVHVQTSFTCPSVPAVEEPSFQAPLIELP